MSGSLQIVADGCQIVEMSDQGTTAAWDGSRRDAEHMSDASNSIHRISHQEVAKDKNDKVEKFLPLALAEQEFMQNFARGPLATSPSANTPLHL